MDPASLLLPAGWTSYFDTRSGRHYFVNANTNPPTTTWDDPRTPNIEIPPSGPPRPQAAAPAQAAVPATTQTPSDLPPAYTPYSPPTATTSGADGSKSFPHAGWLAVLDVPSGRFFFVDKTKSPVFRTWDDPRTAEIETAPATPAPKPPTNPADSSMSFLLRPIEPLAIVSTPYARPPYSDEQPYPPPTQPAPAKPSLLEQLAATQMVGGGGRPGAAPVDTGNVGVAAGALMIGGALPAIGGLI